MSGAASLGALPPAGWVCSEGGECEDGETRCKEVVKEEKEDEDEDEDEDDDGDGNEWAYFKHSQSLQAGDVWRMKMIAGGTAWVGIAAEAYDVERHCETYKSSAWVDLSNGTTDIQPGISEDQEYNEAIQFKLNVEHRHPRRLKDLIPKTLPYDLALRIDKNGNLPQRFNEDGQ